MGAFGLLLVVTDLGDRFRGRYCVVSFFMLRLDSCFGCGETQALELPEGLYCLIADFTVRSGFVALFSG